MSHRFHDLSAHEALVAVAQQRQRAEALDRTLRTLDQNLESLKSDPTLRAFRSKETTGLLAVDVATDVYSDISKRLSNAKHSHLQSHSRSPLLPFRHRDHWTGWAVRFKRRKPDDRADSLDWSITHQSAKPSTEGITTTFHDGERLRGTYRRSTLVPGHGTLDLVCDCSFAYYQEVSMHVIMRDAAHDLNRDTPKTADGRIYLRLPL